MTTSWHRYDGFSGDAICCPTCDNDYTHPVCVESITRYGEDNEKGTRVMVWGHKVNFSQDANTGNPSKRRSGIKIRFSCENGCDDFVVTFAQNKGRTMTDVDILFGQGATNVTY